MINPREIQEHMEVKGSDGGHIGTVDHLDGDRIKLTKSDPASGGEHHYLDLDMVEEIRGGAVCMNATAEQCRQSWSTV